jgi:membrane-bound metal-dependent hydrolase YbcI (DUF457 family)
MKGIAHFLAGIALATLFPEVVDAAASGSLLPVLGGFGGLLPDTLDFKFVQFWETYDIEIDPGLMPDAEKMVDAIAKALVQAYETDVPVHVKTQTLRLSADRWRQYTIGFCQDEGEISIAIGPEVTTNQRSYQSIKSSELQIARRKAPVPFKSLYAEYFNVDIYNGPSFMFSRNGDYVYVRFLDWHRRWTHSLLMAPIIGLCIALISGGLFNWSTALWAGLISSIGYGAHVLADQLGFMGCNIWWPFTRRQKPGLGLFHARDPLPNFLTVWFSLLIIIYNLDKSVSAVTLTGILFIILGMCVPLVVLLGMIIMKSRRHTKSQIVDTEK